MNPFVLMYRSFFDMDLVNLYVRKGKGVGLMVLFLLALFSSLLASVYFYAYVSKISFRMIAPYVEQMPEIKLEGGRIVAPENYKKSFVSYEDGSFFVFDTTVDEASLEGLPPQGIYITKTGITTVKKFETRTISFATFAEEDLLINRDVIKKAFDIGKDFMTHIAPVILFAFLIPSFFFTYVIILFVFTLLSYLYTLFFKKEMTFDERMRIALLSLLPIIFIKIIASVLGVNLYAGISLLVPLVYMFCYFKEYSKTAVVEEAMIERHLKDDGQL